MTQNHLKLCLSTLAFTVMTPLANAQLFELDLRIQSSTTRYAGSPATTWYYAHPHLNLDDSLAQQVAVKSPSRDIVSFQGFAGYHNHPFGTISSSFGSTRSNFTDELFNNGNWRVHDFTDLSDSPDLSNEVIYQFALSGGPGALDLLVPTIIDDNASSLNPNAPVFSWTNPGPGLYDSIRVVLSERVGFSLNHLTSDLLDSTADSWNPSVSPMSLS